MPKKSLAYPSPQFETRLATETVITGRKSWKTLKEKNEVVWPPHLEAALIEALEKYRPGSSGDTRLLRRFPKRNRWVSEYILRTTGKHRTAKQVGSRIQQIRGTCDEARILNLLSRREYSPQPSASPQSTGSSLVASSASPAASVFQLASDIPSPPDVIQLASEILSAPSQTFVTIDILSPCISPFTESPNPTMDLLSFTFEPDSMLLRPDANHRRIALTAEQLLWCQKPIMSFTSSGPIITQEYISFFRVFLDGVHVHTEHTEIELLSKPSIDAVYIYGTGIIPQYWSELCQNSDLSHCQITQEVIRTESSAVALSVVYQFNFRQNMTPTIETPSWTYKTLADGFTDTWTQYTYPYTMPSQSLNSWPAICWNVP